MATITDCHVWAILDDDCEVLAVGQDQVGAWIRYFDGAYYDQPADRIAAIFEAAHGFRCVPCRLVPVEGWAAGRFDAAMAAGGDDAR